MVKIKNTRVKIEVFVPVGSCVCNYAPFMEKIGRITSRFKDAVEVQIKSNKSSEASEYEVQDMGVVVNGKIKLPADFEEQELQDAIIQEKQVNNRS
jgi:hypothetical protein